MKKSVLLGKRQEKEDYLSRTEEGILLIRWQALNTSDHNYFGTLIWIIMVLDIQNVSMFAFNNSILLGCMRIRGLMNNSIFEIKSRYIFLTYSKALSVRSTWIEVENWFFYFIKKSSITLETSELSFRRYSHVMREKSLTKSRKYLKPLIEGIQLGP